jgi:2-oxo-4-hydroxy-4-carboxy--5-ureidoimidazoline (OHCU) decarboxylase
VFVSIKGSDYRWLRQTLERGDLPLVKATAAQLPAVNLEDALSIALLVIEHEPHNAERAAVRWLGRWALESREASLAGLHEAMVAMSALAHEPERWEAVLRGLIKA